MPWGIRPAHVVGTQKAMGEDGCYGPTEAVVGARVFR
jgi:hypothetical protein